MSEFDKLFKLWVKSAHLFTKILFESFFLIFIKIKVEEENVIKYVKIKHVLKKFSPKNTRKLHIHLTTIYSFSTGNSSECSLMNVCGWEHHHHDFQMFFTCERLM